MIRIILDLEVILRIVHDVIVISMLVIIPAKLQKHFSTLIFNVEVISGVLCSTDIIYYFTCSNSRSGDCQFVSVYKPIIQMTADEHQAGQQEVVFLQMFDYDNGHYLHLTAHMCK